MGYTETLTTFFHCPKCNSEYLCIRRSLCFCEIMSLTDSLPSCEPLEYVIEPPSEAVAKYHETKQLYIRMQSLLRDPASSSGDKKRTDDELLVDQIFERILELEYQKWFCTIFFPSYLKQESSFGLWNPAFYPTSPPSSSSALTSTSGAESAGPTTPLLPLDPLPACSSEMDFTGMDFSMVDMSNVPMPTQEEIDELTLQLGVPLEPFKQYDEACTKFNTAAAELQALLPPDQIFVAPPIGSFNFDMEMVQNFVDNLPDVQLQSELCM